jgi:hypothetical protein
VSGNVCSRPTVADSSSYCTPSRTFHVSQFENPLTASRLSPSASSAPTPITTAEPASPAPNRSNRYFITSGSTAFSPAITSVSARITRIDPPCDRTNASARRVCPHHGRRVVSFIQVSPPSAKSPR